MMQASKQPIPSRQCEITAFYNRTAQAYFDATVNLDTSALRERFLAHVPPGGLVVDAGCGSGRDALAFHQAGYQVYAFDASFELAHLAANHVGFPIRVHTFEELDLPSPADAVFASASLLFLAPKDRERALTQLRNNLKPGGVLYACFKKGAGARRDGERTFQDFTIEEAAQLSQEVDGFEAIEAWESEDTASRSTVWSNFMLRRLPSMKPTLRAMRP